MKYAKINDDGTYTITIAKNDHLATLMINDGFLPYECEAKPEDDDLGVLESHMLKLRSEGSHIVGYYEKQDVNLEKVASEIERLKGELAETDYQVVKNQECQMVGLACEYDPLELHNLREPIREAIRELELHLA